MNTETRGVTRPMALQDFENDGEHEGHDPEQMLEMHHRNTLWVPWALILLGSGVLLAPFTLGYLNESLWAQPSGGRGAWFAETETHDSLRAWMMTWSDVISGALLVVLGWRALKPDRPASRWAVAALALRRGQIRDSYGNWELLTR